jgi:hypothetical protein
MNWRVLTIYPNSPDHGDLIRAALQDQEPVVLARAADTGANLAKTNVNGGAIAVGHPLGASGARS